jgi:hypothetical protein
VARYFFAKPPDLPQGLESLQQLREFYLASLKDSPAKLVEIGITRVAGCPAIRLIIKAPQKPSGMTYTGSITIPFRDFSYVLKAQCMETGATGVREAILFEKAMRAGKLTFDPAGIKGEWNPDDPQYDADFAQHPLSRLRRVLKQLEASAALDENVRRQPTFPLPPRE